VKIIFGLGQIERELECRCHKNERWKQFGRGRMVVVERKDKKEEMETIWSVTEQFLQKEKIKKKKNLKKKWKQFG
jgi:hypothetical protein